MTAATPPTKGERTQAKILDAAVDRFGVNGFRPTSVAAIARDAGVSAAAPFAYWPSKEALFDAAVDRDAHDVISELLAIIDEDDPTQLSWIAPVPQLLDILTRHPLSRRVLAGHEPDAIGRLLEIPSFQDLRKHIAQAIIDGQARGVVRADLDPELAASGIESITLALAMAVLQLPEAPGDERTAGIAEVLLASIRPPRT